MQSLEDNNLASPCIFGCSKTALMLLLLLAKESTSFRFIRSSLVMSPKRRVKNSVGLPGNFATPLMQSGLMHGLHQSNPFGMGLSNSHSTSHVFLVPPRFDAIPLPVEGQRLSFWIVYFFIANTIYLLRRSVIRGMPKRRLVQLRLTRERGVTIPLYMTNLIVWQLFVNFAFPVLEPISRLFGYVSFYYFYPNASGVGIIFEPLSVQDQSMSERAKQQIRLDWHKFSVNVGSVGRDGYKHPPSVERNRPHLDIPMLGWKHWPWRRKYPV